METLSRRISLDARFYARRHSRLQPYVKLGAGMDWLDVEDGYYRVGDVHGDVLYWGFAGTAGVGADYVLSRHVVLTGGASYHVCFFRQASSNAVYRTEILLDPFVEHGLDACVSAAVMYHF